MAKRRLKRRPSFLWQALLILLPVCVLAGFGFMSLREDRRIARSEAAERAQFLADDLAQRFWSALTKENASSQAPRYPAFCVDPSGQLLHPLPIPPWPAPAPLTSAELSPAQAQLWRQAEIADAEQKDQ